MQIEGQASDKAPEPKAQRPPRPPPRTMLRELSLADAITLGNGACGVTSIFLCLQYLADDERRFLWAAFVLLPCAFVLDAADGWVARKLKRASRLGGDLDSLADIVSFGVAPAVLAYTLGMRGVWDAAILVYFVLCGIARLARFNATADELAGPSGKVAYFEGTPIPTSLVLVGVLGVAFALDAVHGALWFGELAIGPWVLHPLALLFAASGTAMVSARLRIPKP